MPQKRFHEIDIMRIIGFLLVVDQHILGAYAQRAEAAFADSMILHFLYLLGRPAVPMFIAVTGFTLFYTNYNTFKPKEYYTKRLSVIVIPYLFWSFATIVIFHKYHLLENIIGVLLTGTASYHLWYMGMSTRLYLWFPLLLAGTLWVMKCRRSTQKWIFGLLCVLYLLVLKGNNFLAHKAAALLFETPTPLQIRFFQYSPIFWSIYFLCGGAVMFNYDRFKEVVLTQWKKIAVAYIPLTLYMYYTQICNKLPEYFPRISYEHTFYILYMLATIVLIYVLSVKISEKAGRFRDWLSDLGALSYGGYLVHVIVLQHAAKIIRKAIPVESYLLSGLMIFIATCVVSFGICYVIRFLPFSKYIIGVKRMPLSLVGSRVKSMIEYVKSEEKKAA